MAKITISNVFGIKEEATGEGLQIDAPLTTLPAATVQSLTTTQTLTAGGVYTASSSAGAVTYVMPLASAVPGATFVFRSASAHAHALTGSQAANGTLSFAGNVGALPSNEGSKLALAATQGSSVALISDGLKFLVLAASGSCVISGT